MSKLIRMIYVSTATNPVITNEGVQVDIGRILLQARKNNPPKKVGGVLYFSNNYFFQCLEGEQDEVNTVFQKIITDPRHSNVQTVSVKHIEERMFATWSMKYVALEDNVSEMLKASGFDSFEPYDFNDAMLDKMLSMFTSTPDKSAKPDQNYNKPAQTNEKGLISRLFNRLKIAA